MAKQKKPIHRVQMTEIRYNKLDKVDGLSISFWKNTIFRQPKISRTL